MAGISLANLYQKVTQILTGTRNHAKAGLAIGTTKSKVKTAVATFYSIGGVMYTKAITDDLFVLAGAAFAGATRIWVLCLDASGTASAVLGTSTSEFPDIPDTVCPIGYIKVVAAAGTTFTPGTTLLDAANITTTYVDVSVLPASIA